MTVLVGVMALITLVVLAILIRPLLRRPREMAERHAFDRAVYRDQLRELDRDAASGLIQPTEAKAAAVEIQRRILATDTPETATARTGRSPLLAVGVCVVIVVCAGLVYARLGQPGKPDLPFASRTDIRTAVASGDTPAPTPDQPHTDMRDAAMKLKVKLAANPQDGEGWLLYARTVSMLNDWPEATNAYRRAMELGQNDPDVLSAYGEMLVLAADGIVSPAAHDAFAKAVAADPGEEVARFYLALALSQAGQVDDALKAWLALAADLTTDSPMREEIARRMAEAAQSGGIKAPPLPPGKPPAPEPGPSDDQMANAAQLPDAQRDAMVNGMIDQLATRLKTTPGDRDGWLRLGRAYSVQGKTDQAVDAYDHALQLKPDDTDTKLQLVSLMLSQLKPTDALPARAMTLLHEAAATTPNAPEVLWYLGVEAARDGRRTEARQNWTKLLASLNKAGEDYKLVQGALTQLGTE